MIGLMESKPVIAKISVVMPVLNEGKTLNRSLQALRLSDDEEVLIVDGGSTDDTVSIARQFTKKVFIAQKGRALQMNLGAEEAEGSMILFLHADCILPERGFEIIRRTLLRDGVSAGAFDLSIDHTGFQYRIIECGANLRSHVTRIPYGDQGIFMKKDVFERMGGFADIPLMEDIEISRRLKRIGTIVFIGDPIKTSPRRWTREGPLYTTVRDWIIAISYAVFRTSPDKLIKYYKDIR
jgi:rSAM/selenodomain-associated transferase 2